MRKTFLTGMFYALFLNLAVKTIWIFGIELHVQRSVGTSEYGDYFSLFNFSMLFLILLDLGITNYNTRNIAQNQQLLQKHVGNLLMIKSGLALSYLVIVLVVGFLYGYNYTQLVSLWLLACVQIFNSFTLYLRSNMAAFHHFKADSILSVADRFLLIGACVLFFVVSGSISIQTFIGIQLATALATFVLALIVTTRYTTIRIQKPNWAFYGVIIRKSLPFALLVLTMSFYSRIDALFLWKLLPQGDHDAGVYAAAFRLFDAFSQIAIIFSGVLLPLFSSSFKHHIIPHHLFRFALSMLLPAAATVACMGFFYSSFIAQILYKQDVQLTGNVLQWLLVASVPFALSMIAGTWLTAQGKLRVLNQIAALGLLLNIALNAWLIPQFGALASAWAAIATHGISATCLMLYIVKSSGAFATSNWVFRLLGFLLSLVAGSFLTTFISNAYIGILSFFVLAFTLPWLWQLLSIRDIRAVIVQKSESETYN